MKTKINKILLLILILTIAAFARLWELDSIPPGLYPDEAVNATDALRALESGEFELYYPNNNGREGLFINLLAFAFHHFDKSLLMLRTVPAIIGILTIAAVFFLVREMYNYRTAAVAGFLTAVSYWHINFSRIGFRAILMPLILCLVFYFLFRGYNRIFKLGNYKQKKCKIQNYVFEKLNLKKRKKELLDYLVSLTVFLSAGIVFGVGFYTYIAYRIAPAVVLVFFLLIFLVNIIRVNKKSSKLGRLKKFSKKFYQGFVIPIILPFLTFCLGAFLTTAPLLSYFSNNPSHVSARQDDNDISALSQKNHKGDPIATIGETFIMTLGQFVYKGDGNLRHNLPPNPELSPFVAAMFAIGFIYLIFIFGLTFINLFLKKNKNKKSKKLKAFESIIYNIKNIQYPYDKFIKSGTLLAWFLIMLSPAFLTVEGIPHALRSIGSLPAAYIIASVIIGFMINKHNLIERCKFAFSKKSNKKSKNICFGIYYFNVFIVALALLLTMIFNFYNYFFVWGTSAETARAFERKLVNVGYYLQSLPKDQKKYVFVKKDSKIINTGFPVSVETIRFFNFNDPNIEYVILDQKQEKVIDLTQKSQIVFVEPDNDLINEFQYQLALEKEIIDLNPQIKGTDFIVLKDQE